MKKRILTLLICLAMCIAVIYKLDDITSYLATYFYSTPSVSISSKNKFAKETDYEFVQISKDFVPYNYQELLNIFYTVLDSGYDTFTFYCPSEYEDCIKDVESISDEDNVDILTTIGNYVSPYNNFKSIEVLYDTAGEVTINITHLYSEEDILNITNEIDSIWKSIVTEDMETEDIIYAFHDYIINHTRYDENYESELAEGITPTHQASKANGPLFEGYAICSGYTDAMAILLDKLNIKNIKVASTTHVWNAVYINNEWKHIDLTWDDPVSTEGNGSTEYLQHKFYMIDTAKLKEFDIQDHTFNESMYQELK
jgi:hypothetical protein